jgi:hypothetical protein
VKTASPLVHLNLGQLIIRFLYLNAFTMALAGCATSLIHVDLSKVDAPSAGKASVFVIRPTYLSYAARDLSITANNSKIADLIKLSYSSFLIQPGELRLSGEGGFFSWPRREITIPVEEGQTYYLVWMAKENGSSALMLFLFPIMDMSTIHWELVSKETAQSLLENTYYIESAAKEVSGGAPVKVMGERDQESAPVQP